MKTLKTPLKIQGGPRYTIHETSGVLIGYVEDPDKAERAREIVLAVNSFDEAVGLLDGVLGKIYPGNDDPILGELEAFLMKVRGTSKPKKYAISYKRGGDRADFTVEAADLDEAHEMAKGWEKILYPGGWTWTGTSEIADLAIKDR